MPSYTLPLVTVNFTNQINDANNNTDLKQILNNYDFQNTYQQTSLNCPLEIQKLCQTLDWREQKWLFCAKNTAAKIKFHNEKCSQIFVQQHYKSKILVHLW